MSGKNGYKKGIIEYKINNTLLEEIFQRQSSDIDHLQITQLFTTALSFYLTQRLDLTPQDSPLIGYVNSSGFS